MARHHDKSSANAGTPATHTGNDKANTLSGGSGDDSLVGLGGNDSLEGGAGDDVLNGGTGSDTARFSGVWAGYRVETTADGIVTVTDIDAGDGDDGTDRLLGVDVLQFADYSVALDMSGTHVFDVTTDSTDLAAPVMAGLADGGLVAVWVTGDWNDWEIYARRYDAWGAPLGDELQVNTYKINNQFAPTVAALADGGFVVSWDSYGEDGSSDGVYAQRYAADGALAGGEFLVNTTQDGIQAVPSTTALAGGGFAVSWQSGYSGPVYVQRYGADGARLGTESVVGLGAGDQYAPAMAALADGGYVVSWQSASGDGSGWGIYAQRYDADGTAAGTVFQVNASTQYDQTAQSIAGLAGGGFVAVWQSLQNGSSNDVYAQRYGADGAKTGSEFRVNTTVGGEQAAPLATGLADGGFVVVWSSANPDGSGFGVYAQRYDADGAKTGGEFRANPMSNNATSAAPSVTAVDDGGFVVAWPLADGGIQAQRYDADGRAFGALELNFSGTGGNDSLAGDANANGIQALGGNDTLNGGLGDDTLDGGAGLDTADYAQAASAVAASLFAGTALGSSGADSLIALENLNGSAYADRLTGDGNANRLQGNGGSDVLDGGAGNDTLDGGNGSDTAAYSAAGAAVSLDLSVTGVQNSGGAGKDTFVSIENLLGSAYQDTLKGNAGANLLAGGMGSDTLQGGAGDDVLNGGQGTDTARFSGVIGGYRLDASANGVASLTDIDASDGNDGTDRLSAVNLLQFADGTLSLDMSGTQAADVTTAETDGTAPAMAGLADGGCVVVWPGGPWDNREVYARKYDVWGSPLGDAFRVNTYAVADQDAPSVAAMADGGYVIGWTSYGQDGRDGGIYAQRYAADGAAVGPEFQVHTTLYASDDNQSSPSLAALADGGFVAVWQCDYRGLYAQRYDANGNAAGGEALLYAYGFNGPSQEKVAALADGSYVVAWRWQEDGDNGTEIYAQRYQADGTALGGKIHVNTSPQSDQGGPTITALADGGFVVAWQSAQNGSSNDIYAQRYAADGTALGSEFRVNSGSSGEQTAPAAVALADGGFVLSWSSANPDGSGFGVYAQRYDADGVKIGSEFRADPAAMAGAVAEAPALAALADGGFAVGWPSGTAGIHVQRYDADGSAVAVPVLTGDTAANSLHGGAGSQELRGDAGNDTLDGGAGDDMLDGGKGSDTVTYAQAGSGVAVNLALGTATGGAGTDSLISVETLIGSSYADNCTGDANANTLSGGAGDDTLDGGAGNDSLQGSGGSDTASYASAKAAVTVSLAITKGQNTQGAGTDTLAAMENLAGSAYADNLAGNGNANRLDGAAGNDSLDGGDGNDSVSGGDGNDALLGKSGNDSLDGGAGDDTLEGGAGGDTLRGGDGGDTAVYSNAPVAVAANLAAGSAQGEGNDKLYEIESLTGSGYNDSLIGDGQNNLLNGGGGNDSLDGGAGSDSLQGGAGNDFYYVDSLGDQVSEQEGKGNDTLQTTMDYTLPANVENLVVSGATAYLLTGNDLANRITVENSVLDNDLDGRAGADTMTGGRGDDKYFVDDTGDVIVENNSEGTDLVESSVSYTLGDFVENLTLTGTANLKGTGNLFNNILYGNTGNNVLDGQGGADILFGDLGNDTYKIDNAGDQVVEEPGGGVDRIDTAVSYVLPAYVENMTLLTLPNMNSATGSLNLTGNEQDNILVGNAYDNVIDGQGGADTMEGLQGNDTYFVDNPGDVVIEQPGEGIDLVNTLVTLPALYANVENLTLIEGYATDALGNGLDNVLTGNSADNLLDGGDGGRDTASYAQAPGGVTVSLFQQGRNVKQETGGAGVDTLVSIENLTGSSYGDFLVGNDGDNTVDGGAGDDTVEGGSGAGDDLYEGGDGSDFIVYASATQAISVDLLNGTAVGAEIGNDTLVSIENVAGGSGGDFLAGDNSANRLQGEAGNDWLQGNGGNDTLNGGQDADLFVFAAGGNGVDLIEDLSIDDAIEIDGAAFSGTIGAGDGGNVGQNQIQVSASGGVTTVSIGTNAIAGADVLIQLAGVYAPGELYAQGAYIVSIADGVYPGTAGADTLAGHGGNDTYTVNHAGDTIKENPNEGDDTALAGISYTLPANVERLTLTGTAAIDGTGNGLDNTLIGNNAANVLKGLDGADRIDLGADGKADTVVLGGASTFGDSVSHFNAGAGGADKLDYTQALVNGNSNTAALASLVPAAIANAGGLSANGVLCKLNGSASNLTVGAVANLLNGAPAANLQAGDTLLFAVDDGTDTGLYRFVENGTNTASVAAGELALVATLLGVSDASALAAGDIV